MSQYWSFKNYQNWKKNWPTCTAKSQNQSPINIKRSKLEPCRGLCQLKLNYNPSKCNVITHNEVVTIRYDPGSFAYYGGDVYELIEAKIHIPSMHLVDGQQYDMEVDLYHCRTTDRISSSSGDNINVCPDGGLIIGVFCQSGVEFGDSQNFFSQFINKVPIPETFVNKPIEKSIEVSSDWNIAKIIPENKSFYTYDGSRPYPPCDEKWKWIIFQDYVGIGSTNFQDLKYNLSDNNRPILPIFDRIVYHYNQPKLTPHTDDDDKSSTTGIGVIQLLNQQKRTAWLERNKDFIKRLLYTLIVIVLMLLALRIVIVILKQGIFQNWINSQLMKKQFNNSGGAIPMTNQGINPTLVNQGINPTLVNQGINPTLVNQGINPSMNTPSMNTPSMNTSSMNPSSMSQPNNPSVSPSISQPINPSVSPSMSQPMNPSI